MANDFKRMWTKEEVEKTAQGVGVTEEQFEELVRATPTEVSIIEDQGKLELMLEHDGNVLAVNDTPNQFLQRRLDKPSAEWNSQTSETDLKTWLETQNTHVFQFVVITIDYEHRLTYVNSVSGDTNDNIAGLTSVGFMFYNNNIIIEYSMEYSTETIFIHTLSEVVTYSFNDVQKVQIF